MIVRVKVQSEWGREREESPLYFGVARLDFNVVATLLLCHLKSSFKNTENS